MSHGVLPPKTTVLEPTSTNQNKCGMAGTFMVQKISMLITGLTERQTLRTLLSRALSKTACINKFRPFLDHLPLRENNMQSQCIFQSCTYQICRFEIAIIKDRHLELYSKRFRGEHLSKSGSDRRFAEAVFEGVVKHWSQTPDPRLVSSSEW